MPKIEIEVTDVTGKMMLKEFQGEGECALGKFEIATTIPGGMCIYHFADIGGEKRSFLINHKNFVEAITDHFRK